MVMQPLRTAPVDKEGGGLYTFEHAIPGAKRTIVM